MIKNILYSIWLLSRCLVRREGNKIKLLMLTTPQRNKKKNWIYFKRLFKAHTLIYFRLFLLYRMHITIIHTHTNIYARLSAKLNSFYDDWKLNTIIHQIVNSYCAMFKSPIQLYRILYPPSTNTKGLRNDICTFVKPFINIMTNEPNIFFGFVRLIHPLIDLFKECLIRRKPNNFGQTIKVQNLLTE